MYAAMRPRFGGGARTVLYSATAVWYFIYSRQVFITGELFQAGHPEYLTVLAVGTYGLADPKRTFRFAAQPPQRI